MCFIKQYIVPLSIFSRPLPPPELPCELVLLPPLELFDVLFLDLFAFASAVDCLKFSLLYSMFLTLKNVVDAPCAVATTPAAVTLTPAIDIAAPGNAAIPPINQYI